MIDVGTLGSTPSQVNLNNILIELNDKKVTNLVMGRWMQAKNHLTKLKKYVKPQSLEFYDQLLMILHERHINRVDKIQNSLPKDVYTHLRCCVVGIFRAAHREIQEGVKENIRRVQKGKQPL